MAEGIVSNVDFPIARLTPDVGVSLESVLFTEELARRPPRPPDYIKENRALVRLASALAESPSNILRTLVDTILDVTECDSAGLSLLTRDDGGSRFYWPAVAGSWSPHTGGGAPRDFCPCGVVLDRNCTLLFRHAERRYPYLETVMPAAEELLLVPFHVGGRAVGTIWAIMHTNRRNFDAEDDRLMTSLGKFASVAYQATSAIEDLTSQVAAREAAEARVRELAQGLQAKLRCLVDASIIGIFIWNAAGQIIEANDAFLRLVGSRREDVISGRLSWRELTPVEWQDVDEQRIVDLKASGIARPFEKEFFRKDGTRVPILMGAAVFDDTQDEGVAFVIDLTDRKRAEEAARASDLRYNELRMELAHANRVATLGQLSASIAHEVNQPLSGIVTNASTCLRMLAADVPNIEGARGTARRIIRDSNRAADVIVRLRTLFSKRDAATESIDLNGAIKEATALARSELDRNNVILGHELAEMLPSVAGNRVQLQQVILNLLMNASQAMSSVDDRPRQLVIKTERDEYGRVRVTMRDAGVGLDPRTADKLFDPFYTTKNDGMGIGLSVSRSIIESLGGQIWIGANDGPGATVSFSIPI